MSLSNSSLVDVDSTCSTNRQAANELQQQAWFAIWTRSRYEQLVCRELTARSIENFLPTITHVSKWKDRKKQIRWPLFPGYCFARFDAPSLLRVLKCEGVVTVLSNGSKPVAVPDVEIEGLQRLVASGLSYDPCTEFRAGTMARVVNGPLAGIVGRVERQGSQDHLILAVDLLNSGARVQVAAWDLEPCN